MIRAERPQDGPHIETLLDLAFGPARRARPAYRLREGTDPLPSLCLVAQTDDRVAGTIRFWPLQLDGEPAVLLGPIAVHPDFEGRGIGRLLVSRGLAAARDAGHSHVIAVGSADYLGRFGFHAAAEAGLRTPEGIPAERYLSLRLAETTGRAGGSIVRRAMSHR